MIRVSNTGRLDSQRLCPITRTKRSSTNKNVVVTDLPPRRNLPIPPISYHWNSPTEPSCRSQYRLNMNGAFIGAVSPLFWLQLDRYFVLNDMDISKQFECPIWSVWRQGRVESVSPTCKDQMACQRGKCVVTAGWNGQYSVWRLWMQRGSACVVFGPRTAQWCHENCTPTYTN